MEISSLDLDASYDPPLLNEPKAAELIGKVSLYVSTLLAAAAFVPLVLHKKRLYTPFSTPSQPLPSLPIEFGAVQGAPIPLELPRCNEQEGKTVAYIFNAIADWGYRALIQDKLSSKEERLEKRGETIAHLHPFALLMAIPKSAMKKIFSSPWINSFQIRNVMDGIVSGMLREQQRNRLTPHIPAFAKAMKKEGKRIADFIHNQKWRELVDYLFDI